MPKQKQSVVVKKKRKSEDCPKETGRADTTLKPGFWNKTKRSKKWLR